MWQKNDGIGEKNTLQNQFTKYFITSIKRQKAKYLANRSKMENYEVPMDQDMAESTENSMHQILDGIVLEYVLNQISEREQYILFARILDNCEFEDIAKKLGIGYKGVYSIYHRALQKLRRML